MMDLGSPLGSPSANTSSPPPPPPPSLLHSPFTLSTPPRAIASRSSSRTALRGSHYNTQTKPPVTPPPRSSRNASRNASKRNGKEESSASDLISALTTNPKVTHRSTHKGSHKDSHDHHDHHDSHDEDEDDYDKEFDSQGNARPLSWSSVTRDSVVDNLLSSFDRMAAFSSFDDHFDVAASPPRISTRLSSQRPRGHTYSSSLSTDVASPDDAVTYYSRSSQGKRSNSGSSYVGSPLSILPIRNARDARDGRPMALARSSSETQRTARNHSRTRPSARKSSKSSMNSSFDISHIGGLPGIADSNIDIIDHEQHNRSAPEVVTLSSSILGRGRPVPSLYSAYEPPHGQAKDSRPTRGPSTHLQPSASSSTKRTSSHTSSVHGADADSAKGDTSRAQSTTQEIPKAIRDQASDFVKATNMRSASPVPAQSARPTFPNAASEPIARRPGFFRRVFGSSNRSSTNVDVVKQLQRDFSLNTVAVETPQQTRNKSTPAPESATPNPRPDAKTVTTPPNVVNKKPSFFRRRKMSVDEESFPPSIPPQLINPSHRHLEQENPSSPGASSLKKVLDPYLAEIDAPTPSGQIPLSRFAVEKSEGDTDSLDMFHSGYTPPPDASLRRSAPLEHRSSINPKPLEKPDPMLAPKPRTPPDPEKLQVQAANRDPQRPQMQHSSSFLSDASDISERSKASSGISAVSESYIGQSNGALGPVSPIASPIIEYSGSTSFFLSPSTTNSEWGPISPGATIRAVTSDSGGAHSDGQEYGVKESKGLAIRISPAAKHDRLWIDPAHSEDDTVSSELSLPREGLMRPQEPTPNQHDEGSGQRKDSVPVVEVNGNEVRPSVDIARRLDELTSPEPSAEDMDRARKIYAGEEDFVTMGNAAAWLGEKTQISARTLIAYMSFFDWAGHNILSSMRKLCEKLVLKGESQQVDRILEAFAARWDECNPNNGFKGTGVIHNICYALLLLNTDQHIANIQHKMTRSEFIKNTMPAIKDAAEKTARPTRENSRSTLPSHDHHNSSVPSSPTMPHHPQDEAEERSSIDFKQKSRKRVSLRPMMNRNETDPGPGADINNYASNVLINFTYEGTERGWLLEIETVLKSFYTSICADALPLHGVTDREGGLGPLTNNLSVQPGGLRRTGSVISKAPSEGFVYRGRKTSETQSLAQRMHSKNRMRQKVYPASTVGSSRTSFDDNSMLSPAGSSMWSKISTGRTGPTMSVESFALTQDFKQSLGFTNALSQAIIREEYEATSDSDSFHRVGSLLEDESLELAGAPWAKEGMVKHKHHLEGPEKKAKERSWNECFAVVEKGYLHLFSFKQTTTKIGAGTARARRHTTSSKTPGKAPSIAPSVVGGGNWTDNAEELGQFLLRQTIATSLPAPGYSKSRPHVWALSLPTGAVHLFQVGTAEIAEEFASTANYWSARLSKEPLVGGVDNIEYGWSDNIINPALVASQQQSPPPSRSGGYPPPAMSGHAAKDSMGTISNVPRPSTQSSLRTSFDQNFGNKARLPGDRAVISDWRPPASSMLPSQLLEIDQLRSLKAYITSVEAELQRHNELRGAIPLAYTNPNGARLAKVMTNWERKSSYLLKEVVKFRTYIEALERAGSRREEVYEERRIREEENAAARAAPSVAFSA